MNTALLAEYLVLTHFQAAKPSPEEFRKMNRLALQLAMELPDDVLAVVFKKSRTGTYQDAWDAVDAIRRHTCPDDPRNSEHCGIHAPNAYKLMERKTQ